MSTKELRSTQFTPYLLEFQVPMKRKLSLGSYKIYPFKHALSKFEIAAVKIADFVSAQS